MALDYEITKTITPAEYMSMREAVGWGLFPLEEAEKSLKDSYIWCIRVEGRAIGLGRVIWDHGYVIYIADIIVLPEYQGQGLGRVIMENIMAFIHEQLKPGYRFMVSLSSAKGKDTFYEKFGFVSRPTDSVGPGMFQWFISELPYEEKPAKEYEVLRAEEEWQRAGAYSVRIEGMNRQSHIPLREEFDEHDCDGTKYIVLLDDGYPVATCRFYENGNGNVTLGRVVVLPEYRGKGLGFRVVEEAEKWIKELGYSAVEIDSRTNAVGFYEKLGYKLVCHDTCHSGCFECLPRKKELN